MKTLLYTLLFVVLTGVCACEGQPAGEKSSLTLDRQKKHLLAEADMLRTTEGAVKLIQWRNYSGLRHMFAPEVASNISEQQLALLVDQIATIFENEGVPTGNQNILPALNASIKNGDTVFINNIIYKFRSTDGESNRVLTFSFHEKFGPSRLIGMNLNVNPTSAAGKAPTIRALEKIEFSISDISQFRIYYDEGRHKQSRFRNETGFFALEGDNARMKLMGIETIISEVLRSLAKRKPDAGMPFNTIIDRKEATKFIQADFVLINKPYGLFIYLPIDGGGKYAGKIVVQQREFANVGYQYILNQADYPELVAAFPKIAEMKLDRFYEEKP